MTRKILILTILAATAFFALPTDTPGYADKRAGENFYRENAGLQKRGWDNKGRRRRSNRSRNRSYYGYRNYGQYRRTQVGNRRYRLVRRPYWRNGIRLTRLVRLYY
jgi:hypothetical protein